MPVLNKSIVPLFFLLLAYSVGNYLFTNCGMSGVFALPFILAAGIYTLAVGGSALGKHKNAAGSGGWYALIVVCVLVVWALSAGSLLSALMGVIK